MVTHEAASSVVQEQEPEKKARYLRVGVVDTTKDGRPAVNLHVPLGVFKWGMTMAQHFSPEMKDANLDLDSITAQIHEGARGEIVHVEDEGEHKTIDVWVE